MLQFLCLGAVGLEYVIRAKLLLDFKRMKMVGLAQT